MADIVGARGSRLTRAIVYVQPPPSVIWILCLNNYTQIWQYWMLYIGTLVVDTAEFWLWPRKNYPTWKWASGNVTDILAYKRREFNSCNAIFRFNITGTSLDKKDLLGKSDPFLTISKSTEGGTWTVIHRTEYIRKVPLSLQIIAL